MGLFLKSVKKEKNIFNKKERKRKNASLFSSAIARSSVFSDTFPVSPLCFLPHAITGLAQPK